MFVTDFVRDFAEHWHAEEQSVEEKITRAEFWVFQRLGFQHDPLWYKKKGAPLERYLAGFVSRYFFHLRELSFLVLDPIHIATILFGFVRGVLFHPLKTMKGIWKVWTGFYFQGFYAMGAITADALMAALIVGSALSLKGGSSASVLAKESASAFVQKAEGWAFYAPRKIISKGKMLFEMPEKIFEMVRGSPVEVIRDAEHSFVQTASVGKMREYKWYTESFLQKG